MFRTVVLFGLLPLLFGASVGCSDSAPAEASGEPVPTDYEEQQKAAQQAAQEEAMKNAMNQGKR